MLTGVNEELAQVGNGNLPKTKEFVAKAEAFLQWVSL
jgi:hypothetical protein